MAKLLSLKTLTGTPGNVARANSSAIPMAQSSAALLDAWPSAARIRDLWSCSGRTTTAPAPAGPGLGFALPSVHIWISVPGSCLRMAETASLALVAPSGVDLSGFLGWRTGTLGETPLSSALLAKVGATLRMLIIANSVNFTATLWLRPPLEQGLALPFFEEETVENVGSQPPDDSFIMTWMPNLMPLSRSRPKVRWTVLDTTVGSPHASLTLAVAVLTTSHSEKRCESWLALQRGQTWSLRIWVSLMCLSLLAVARAFWAMQIVTNLADSGTQEGKAFQSVSKWDR
eukprot:CAMPEP_0175135734 /NCGR_PEP_ID=MMETSP0087-20121206/8896_1 /TAXON_ID=136419 /ORGANISM="Unknown Unknown, Strain D1" /LENGTH=286 /DNA_ID=CAMNT_0016418435 /DNA_START=1260 /DNA_END=2121 /DNA_ORIENTATION=-